MNKVTPVNLIEDEINGFYREHERIPVLIEVNKTEWEALRLHGQEWSVFESIGLIRGIPVMPLDSVEDWNLIKRFPKMEEDR